MMEYRTIPGYGGLYEASDDGRIYGLKCRRPLKPRIKDGYETVTLCKDGKKRYFRVHRLIAFAFIPNPYDLPEIDHINGNPRDNRVCNLRWASRRANQNNPITRARLSKSLKGRKITWEIKCPKGPGKPVDCFKDGVFIRRFKNAMDAERVTGIDNRKIYEALKGRRKSAGGYNWKYAL
ncbi:MAG: HNH endonuclease [Alphaproteobacteria bacterium]